MKSRRFEGGSSFLRWAGSKRKLIPKLEELIPSQFNKYIEPFSGSACLFFHISPNKAILGDINLELINTYIQIRDFPQNVCICLESIPNRTPEIYYQVRALNPQQLTNSQRAARFIYLNRLCFNGLYRTNANGEFNVPFGGERAGKLPSRDDIDFISKKLINVQFIEGDFLKTINHAVSDDFVYLDPPYSIANRRVFNSYSNHEFGTSALKSLSESLNHLHKIGVKFLVSYGKSREGLTLAESWNCKQTVVQRQIAGFAAHRKVATELLITNY